MFKFFKTLFPRSPASIRQDETLPLTPAVLDESGLSRKHQLRGKAFLAEGKFVEAAEAFRQTVEMHPEQVEGYINLGYALSELAQFEDAEPILQKAVAIDPVNVDGLYMLATVSRTVGKTATAISTLDRLLSLHPDFEMAYSELCDLLLGSDQHQRAISTITKGIEQFPESGRFHYIFGTMLATTGAYEEAAVAFTTAIRLQPDYAELHFSLGSVRQTQGKLQEAVASYRRAVSIKPDYLDAYANLGTSLLGLQQNDAALLAFDSTLAVNPNHFATLINKSTVMLHLKRHDDALVLCDRAIATRSDRAEAFINRGVALKNLSRFEEALSSYHDAHLLKPLDGDILVNRANVLQRLNRHQEALDCLDQALLLNPASTDIFLSRGASLLGLYRHQDALESWARAIGIDPDCADAHFNESLCRLQLGDFERGWSKHEWRWRTEQFGKTQRLFAQPQWSGKESLAGKTILLHPEQGLGDTIQFSRYAKLVAAKGATVVLMVQPPLKELLASVEGVSHVVSPVDPLPPFDYHCALLSLPLLLNVQFDSIVSSNAYVQADVDRIEVWAKRLGKKEKPRVGIVWSGNSAHSNDHNRSVPLHAFVKLISSEAEFFSLKHEVRADDVAVLNQHPEIVHYGDELRSFVDTAGLISNMDLVISVDTSLAHLTGALGKPLWILLPSSSDWRWFLDRGDSPWYPSAKLFRQSRDDDTNEAIETIAKELRDFIRRVN